MENINNSTSKDYIRIDTPEIEELSEEMCKLILDNPLDYLDDCYDCFNKINEFPNSFYLTKYDDNKTLLEKMFENGDTNFDDNIIEKRVKQNPEILKIFVKNNIYPIDVESSDFFLIKIDDNITYLEYLIDNNPTNLIDNLIKHKDNEVIKNSIFKILNEKDKYSDNNIDVIVQLTYWQEIIFKLIKTNNRITNILFDLLDKQKNNSILTTIERFIHNNSKETVLAFYKQNFHRIKPYIEDLMLVIMFNLDENIAKYFIEIKEYSLLVYTSTDILLSKYDNENTILSILLKNGYCFSINDDILKQLVSNNNFEELYNYLHFETFDKLLDKIDGKKTLLELLLENNELRFSNSRLWKKIEYYIQNDIRFAKIYLEHEKMPTLLFGAGREILDTKIDEEINLLAKTLSKFYEDVALGCITIHLSSKLQEYALLYKFNGTTLLETLLKKYKAITIYNIINNEKLSSNIEIQTILKLNGIDLERDYGIKINHKFDIKNIIDNEKEKFLKEMYEPYYSENIDDEIKSLIDELRSTFKEDGKSDDDIIELACNTFKFMFLNNNKYAKRDILALTNIKKNNPDFILIKGEKTYFQHPQTLISMESKYNINSFMHELYHLLHYYLKNNEVPEIFDINKYNINNEKFELFLEIYRSIRRKLEKKFSKDYYAKNYNASKDMEIHKIRCLEILERYKGIYSDEIINYLKDNIPGEEEYKKYYNKEMTKNIICEEYTLSLISSIIDIIDALKQGTIYDNGIKYGEHIYSIGHGSEYYSNNKKIFIEIFAQYATLINAPNNSYYISFLEGIVGPELIELLDDFYDNLTLNIVNKKQK